MEIEGLTLSDDEIESKEIDEMIQSMRDKRLKDDGWFLLLCCYW